MLRGVCSFERHKAMQMEQLESTDRRAIFRRKEETETTQPILRE